MTNFFKKRTNKQHKYLIKYTPVSLNKIFDKRQNLYQSKIKIINKLV
jgi:hypothetical protein